MKISYQIKYYNKRLAPILFWDFCAGRPLIRIYNIAGVKNRITDVPKEPEVEKFDRFASGIEGIGAIIDLKMQMRLGTVA